MAKKLYQPGDRIGPYEVVGFLGYGGMGVVYECRLGDMSVAVKVAPDGRAHVGPELYEHDVRRMEREFSALLPLEHRNIVRVHSFGRTEAGEPYFAMERIQGTPFEDWIRGRHEPHRVVDMFIGIARGVAELHQLGLVHRDLKPSNVLLRDDGEPVLIDFGVVKSGVVPRLTLTNDWLGTLQYSAPELAARVIDEVRLGEPIPYSPAYDVHALGLMIYEALTGRFPFEAPGEDPLGVLVLKEILRKRPRHPSDVAPEVPRALGDLVMRMLRKNPKRRPRDGGEVLAALSALKATNLRATTTRRTQVVRALRWAAVALVVLAMLAVLAMMVLHVYRRPAAAPPGDDKVITIDVTPKPAEPAPTGQVQVPPVKGSPAVPAAAPPQTMSVPEPRQPTRKKSPAATTAAVTFATIFAACAGSPVRPDGLPTVCPPPPRDASKLLGVSAGFEFDVAFLNKGRGIKYGHDAEGHSLYILPAGDTVMMEYDRPSETPNDGRVPAPFPIHSLVYGTFTPIQGKPRLDIIFTRLVLEDGREFPICAVGFSQEEYQGGRRGVRLSLGPPTPEPGRYVVDTYGFTAHVLQPF